jgi:hypothetical protein
MPLVSSLIDPELSLGTSERRSIMRKAWKQWMHKPRNATLYGFGLVGVLVVFMFGPDFIEPLIGGHRWYYTILWFLLYLVGIVVLMFVLRHIGLAPCVYEELRARGYDVCPRCGYLQTGVPPDAARCPECGSARRAFVMKPENDERP